MGKATAIEWADSTLNMMMGCDGCELSSRSGFGTCYAETLTERYGGSSKGYPVSFYEPRLFALRLEEALRWSDLVGTERPEKPWLSGLPRCIFNGDMGDYWTESLPLDWLAPYVARMAASPHTWIFLTKRPARMRKFWQVHGPVPPNFVLMTSVTSQETAGRIADLCRIPDCTRGLSCEPLLGAVDLCLPGVLRREKPAGFDDWSPDRQERAIEAAARAELIARGGGVSWVICGGESGPGARPMHPEWARSLRDQCDAADVRFFFKQWGEWRNGSERAKPREIVLADGSHAPTAEALGFTTERDAAGRYWHDLYPTTMARVGKKASGRLLDGREWNEMPEVAHA